MFDLAAAPAELLEAFAALRDGSWADALALATSVGPCTGLVEADRLDVMAEASWWLGRLDDCIAAREEAYRRYDEFGASVHAGSCAVWLWEHHQIKACSAIAGAWLRRARRALSDAPETAAMGALLLREAEVAHSRGELDRAGELAGQALALGRRLPCADLEAEALQTLGRLLIDEGRITEGLGHLDEAMLSAVEGRLSPYSTGKVHCSMISACEELGDLRRAAEWTEATLRWSERHPLAMWPAICRVHHAALLLQQGQWPAAEREARRACDELTGFHLPNVAAGYVEIGEVRRRLGDLAGAEAAFAKAEALTGRQSAGLALVRLAQGRIDAASAVIHALLAGPTWNPLARGRLLPAQIQIAVAAGNLGLAEAAVCELERIAENFRSPVLIAAALSGRGRVLLAEGKPDAACPTLRQALGQWQELGVPYEVATTRLLLGYACRSCGDEDAAISSIAAAAEIFDRLGAATAALGEPAWGGLLPAGLTPREAEVLLLVADGLTNRQVAGELHLSERTVARHLSNVFIKLEVTSRTAAAAFAHRHAPSLAPVAAWRPTV